MYILFLFAMEQMKKEDIVDLLEPQEVKSLTQQYEANIQSKLNDWMTNCLEKEKVRKSGSPQSVETRLKVTSKQRNRVWQFFALFEL